MFDTLSDLRRHSYRQRCSTIHPILRPRRNSLLPTNYEDGTDEQRKLEVRRRNRQRLTDAICGLLDDYTFVSFVPLNIRDEDSIDHCLTLVDATIQYGEDLEVRGMDNEEGGAGGED
jgi:hypothetical protein